MADIVLPLIGNVALNGNILVVFIGCFVGVFAFEFVNGFHDTANAVATVIYTKALKPLQAVIWSGIWNFLGVFIVGTAVAMSLLKLVPLDKIVTLPVQVGACLVLAILIASILWNVSTWYIGIPLSSSHTLIGAMIGGSLAFAYYYSGGVNWDKAKEIGLSLLISPVIGFAGSYLLLLAEKKWIHSTKLFHTPQGDNDIPPPAIRALLITTCTLVSFFHGSNDGQKGVGLMMLVLIAFLPAHFMINEQVSSSDIQAQLLSAKNIIAKINMQGSAANNRDGITGIITGAISQVNITENGDTKQRFAFRKDIQKVTAYLSSLKKDKSISINDDDKKLLDEDDKKLRRVTDFAPLWVLAIISIALGLGTMIGWKRIVVTIGEKIGTNHLNYAQGATAEIVAAATIGLSTGFGLPVSTTHVLSSGVAGAMAATNGRKSLNFDTIKHILYAWLLTLPAAIALAFLLFVLFHLFI